MSQPIDGSTASLAGSSGALLRGPGRVSDTLTERLDAMIRAGELKNGTRLPSERDLMQRFGLSRSVIREAIANLASRGLLATRPGYRPVIRKPDYETALGTIGHVVEHLLGEPGGMWNLFESRIFIEGALARFAAAHARRDDIEALREALERNGMAIGDPEAFYATDIDFHAVLYRIPRNPIYPALHKAYVAWLISHWQEMERAPDIDRLNHRGHAGIFEAVVARDPDGAEAALRRHLEVAWEFVRDTFPAGTAEARPIPSRADAG